MNAEPRYQVTYKPDVEDHVQASLDLDMALIGSEDDAYHAPKRAHPVNRKAIERAGEHRMAADGALPEPRAGAASYVARVYYTTMGGETVYFDTALTSRAGAWRVVDGLRSSPALADGHAIVLKADADGKVARDRAARAIVLPSQMRDNVYQVESMEVAA